MTTIRENYPEISSLVTKYNFYDSETDKLTSSTEGRELNLDLISRFNVNCICWECVDGGYDLNNIVRMSIKDRLSHITGSLTCQGWQDRERINKHRCYTRLEYFININYYE